MAVKLKVKILEASYVADADAILILGECEKGKLRHQIHSSCFTFGNQDKSTAMSDTAKLMLGKSIWMVFDEELNEKIEDHQPLKY